MSQTNLVYPEIEDKNADGTTTATIIGLKGDPGDSFDVAIDDGGTASFDNASPGTGKTVNFSGFSLTGGDAGAFAFKDVPAFCCIDSDVRTTGNIVAASTPPGDTPPEDSDGSDSPTPTSPTPTTLAPTSPTPTTPVPDLDTLLTTVPQIVASTSPSVAFSPPAGGVNPNLALTGIKMPPPVELVEIEAVQPEATEPQELAPKPDRN